MFKIGVNFLNSIAFGNKKEINTAEKNNIEDKKQIDELQNAQPTYQVKTPMSYSILPDLHMPNDITAKCFKLANGQKVIVVPKKGETTIRTYVNTGSMNEPDNLRGISHYIEHNLFNGSEGLGAGEFFKKVHEMGGDTNASTGFDQTNYYISSNLLRESDFDDMVRYHASMLETPKFTLDTLEKEKGIVCSEINMITQNPSNLVVNRAIKNLYGIETNSADMIGGRTDNIQMLTRDDVIKYYNDNYYPGNMTTVITGDVNVEDAISTVAKYFSSKNIPENPQKHEVLTPITKIKREDMLSDKATSTQLAVVINGPKNSDLKEKLALDFAFEFLVGGVSSKVNSKLKQDDVFVSHSEERFGNRPEDNTIRILEANSDDGGIEKALKTIINEVKNFDAKKIKPNEFEVMKKTAIKYHLMWFDENFEINSRIGNAFLKGNTDIVENYENVMNSITLDDINNAFEKYLKPKNFSVAVVHPATDTEDDIKAAYNKVNDSNVSFTGNAEKVNNKSNRKIKEVRNVSPLDLSTVENFILPNNINLVINNTPEKLGYMKILLDRKQVDREHPVEAMLLNSLLQEGSINKNAVDFYKEVKDNGINMDISAGAEYIKLTADYFNQDIDKVFEKAREVIYSPRFTAEEFNKVKEFLKKELILSEKSPYDKLYHELEPRSFLTKEQILERLETIKLEEIKQLYSEIISNSKVTVAVSGAMKGENFRNNLISQLMLMQPAKKFEYQLKDTFVPVKTTKVLTDTDYKNQAEILEYFSFKVNQNVHDIVALSLMNRILGGSPSSRLFRDLREQQQLCYRVKSTLQCPDDENNASITLSIGTTTENKDTGERSYDNLQKSIQGFNSNIKSIMSEKVTEEELENAKLAFKNALLNKVQSSEDKNIELCDSFLRVDGLSSLNKIMSEIDSITIDDIYNAANFVFSTKPMYSIVATENTLKANEDFLKSLEA